MVFSAINLYEDNVHHEVLKHEALKHPELENNKKLSEYGVKYESKLYLLIGKSYPIHLSGNLRVSDVKQEVKKINKLKDEGVLKLFFGGEDLDDTKSLSHYDVKNGCIFFVNILIERIFVKTSTGNMLDIKCSASSTIAHVKGLVTKREGISSDQKQLFFNGKFLESSRMLKEYNIVNESLLCFECKPNTIFVKTLEGNIFNISFSPTSTVEFIKTLVTKQQGIPIDQQRIIFAGKQLEDNRMLKDYHIFDNSIVHLVLRLRGGDECFVKLPNGKGISCEISPEFTVQELKEQIFRKEMVSPCRQILLYKGQILENNKRIYNYISRRENTIHLKMLNYSYAKEVFVEVLGRNEVIHLPLNIENVTIQDLKRDIEKIENIRVEEQHIFFYSAKK